MIVHLVDGTYRNEEFPENLLGKQREQALLFKLLATPRTDARLFRDLEEIRWREPTARFASWEGRLADKRLMERAVAAAALEPG